VQTAYNIREVEAPAEGFSRFFREQTPAGWGSQPKDTVAHVYRSLLAEALVEAEKHPARQMVEVALKFAARNEESGEVELHSRTVIAGQPEFENRRPTRRWWKLKGAALLDSFFLGTEAFENAPDLEVWAALRDAVEAQGFDGRALRQVNDLTAMLVACRAGLRIPADKLPYPQPPKVVIG
jgi:hypothetical protein